jgi:hypothetical protein
MTYAQPGQEGSVVSFKSRYDNFMPRNTFGQGRLSARLPLNGKSLGGSMHLGLARAQLLPRSDGYRRFTGSPIDALVYLVGLSCQIPIRLALRTIIHRRVAAPPTAVARVPG